MVVVGPCSPTLQAALSQAPFAVPCLPLPSTCSSVLQALHQQRQQAPQGSPLWLLWPQQHPEAPHDEALEAVLNAVQQDAALAHSVHTLLCPMDECTPSPQQLSHYLALGVNDVLPPQASLPWLQQHLQSWQFHHRQYHTLQEMLSTVNTLNEELEHRGLQLEKELSKTRVLQQSLLPKGIAPQAADDLGYPSSQLHYSQHGINVSGLYLPCDAIGGDLYDLMEFADGNMGLLMADVSGHGVPAAFITAMLKASFYRITHQVQAPDQVLFQLNNQLAEVITTGDYLTAFYLRLMEQGNLVQFGGAGHPYPLFFEARSGQVKRLEENGTPLVWVPDMEYAMQSQALSPGDKLLLFTDGVSELHNPHGELFGEERLEEAFGAICLACQGGPSQELLEQVLFALSDFSEGHPLQDDLSMVLVEKNA